MSEILKRLVGLTRAHLSDLLGRRLPGWQADVPWEAELHEAGTDTGFTAPPFETRFHDGLPYSDELAGYYRALDLPFGAPMQQVIKRWKAYLKKCHPDRYANDAAQQADATRLTQELTRAYEKIKAAWERHRV